MNTAIEVSINEGNIHGVGVGAASSTNISINGVDTSINANAVDISFNEGNISINEANTNPNPAVLSPQLLNGYCLVNQNEGVDCR